MPQIIPEQAQQEQQAQQVQQEQQAFREQPAQQEQQAQQEQLEQRVQLVLKAFKAFKAFKVLPELSVREEATYIPHRWQIRFKCNLPRQPLGVQMIIAHCHSPFLLENSSCFPGQSNLIHTMQEEIPDQNMYSHMRSGLQTPPPT